MNIFYLDNDPKKAAIYHCDKHVVKMILETAQLLSTAHRVLDGTFIKLGNKKHHKHPNPEKEEALYKATHINHPSAIWVRESVQNYSWAYMLFMYLSDEYEERYNKQHNSWLKLRHLLITPPKNLFNKIPTPIPLAMPDEYKDQDPVVAYRTYYKENKAYMAKWEKLANTPSWW